MKERQGFKIVFRGFAREDVLNYIDELHRTAQEEQETRDEQIANLKAEVSRLQEQLSQSQAVPSSAVTDEKPECDELRAKVFELETALSLTAEKHTAELGELEAELLKARIERDVAREELARAEADVAETDALREREAELSRELTETKQAVAGLWQEKDAAEQKITAVLSFTERLQQEIVELRRQLGENPPAQTAEEPEEAAEPEETAEPEEAEEAAEPEEAEAAAEEAPAPKPMESWLF